MTTMANEELEATAREALVSGDEAAFGTAAESYRRRLHVHCYRMVGSYDDAEDLVQETFIRAWRGRTGFEGRSSVSSWLYRIATNACLNAIERSPRRLLVPEGAPASDLRATPKWDTEIPWLQPYPDRLLDAAASPEAEPETLAVRRETIELIYLAAIQHLPPKQRAVLLLRDALDWSAAEVADLLGVSVAAVNSALQRARATMRANLPARSTEDARVQSPTDAQRAVLDRFMEAFERADAAALTALLKEDARQAMPPGLMWFDGRDAIVALYRNLLGPDGPGEFRMVPMAANRQPAAAAYLRARGKSQFRLTGLNVLRIEGGLIAEITSYRPDLCGAFDLPSVLPDG
jgi:RNA polymerase sigma-70 factor, ECF subfamily